MALKLALAFVLFVFFGSTEQRQNSSSIEAAECSNPFSLVGGECVFVDILTTGTWDDMRTYCRSLGGDLVILHDACFYADLVQFINSHGWPLVKYWVGGTDDGHEGLWVWLDGTPMTMGTPFWAKGCSSGTGGQCPDHSGQNCVIMDSYYLLYLNDYYCDDAAPHPICQK